MTNNNNKKEIKIRRMPQEIRNLSRMWAKPIDRNTYLQPWKILSRQYRDVPRFVQYAYYTRPVRLLRKLLTILPAASRFILQQNLVFNDWFLPVRTCRANTGRKSFARYVFNVDRFWCNIKEYRHQVMETIYTGDAVLCIIPEFNMLYWQQDGWVWVVMGDKTYSMYKTLFHKSIISYVKEFNMEKPLDEILDAVPASSPTHNILRVFTHQTATWKYQTRPGKHIQMYRRFLKED